jgi:hypothetical protein
MQNLLNLQTIEPIFFRFLFSIIVPTSLLLSISGMGTVPPIEIRFEATDGCEIIKHRIKDVR